MRLASLVVACAIALPCNADAPPQAAKQYVQKTNGLVPGLYQIRTGQRFKGEILAVSTACALGTAAMLHMKSDPDEAWTRYQLARSPGAIDRAYRDHKAAEEDRRLARRLLWVAGAVYAVNLLDVVLYRQIEVSAVPAPDGGGVHLAFSTAF